MPTSLADRLATNQDELSNADIDWVQYVKDHRSTLMDSSIKITVPANIMFTNRYRMGALLVALGHRPNIAWVVMWLNQLRDNNDIDALDDLIVPNLERLRSLHQQYKSFKAKKDNA